MASAIYNHSPVGDPQYTGPPLSHDPNYDANMTLYLNNLKSLTGYSQDLKKKQQKYNNTGELQSAGAVPLVVPGSNPAPHIPAYADLDLLSKEQQIQVLRSQLDEKLRELYGTDHSILSDTKMGLDTAVYTGVLWTVLATATVYYLFIFV